MKAIVLEGFRHIELEDIEAPKANGHDVLVKVSKCGICGSDYHSYYDRGDSLVGKVLGHEYSGYVVDAGCRTDLKVGDKVTVCPATGCGHCDTCLTGHSNLCGSGHEDHGAFAEYIICAPEGVIKLPEGLSLEEAAMLEPLATAVRATRQVGIRPGSNVLVIGGGIIGATTANMCRASGAIKVVMAEANIKRTQSLLDRGIVDALVDSTQENAIEALKAENNGKLYDYVFECAGAGPAMKLAIDIAAIGGTIGLVGANPQDAMLNMRIPVIKELRIQASYAYDRLDFENGMRLVRAGIVSVKEYATKTIKLDEVPQAFEDLRTHKVEDIKVMVDVEASV